MTKIFPGRTPIREVVADVVPRNGAEPHVPTLETRDGAEEVLPATDALAGFTAEIERLERARRDAEALAADARARAEAARAEVEREVSRLAELKGEAARLEEALTAQVRLQVAQQEAAPAPEAARTVATATPERETEPEVAPVPEPPAQQAASQLVCKVEFWRGYRKGAFYARTNDGGEDVAVAESPMFKARGNGVPDRTDEAAAAYATLVERLESDGWHRVQTGSDWFDATFAREP